MKHYGTFLKIDSPTYELTLLKRANKSNTGIFSKRRKTIDDGTKSGEDADMKNAQLI